MLELKEWTYNCTTVFGLGLNGYFVLTLTTYLSTIAGSRYGIPIDVSHVNIDTESFVLSAFLKLQMVSSP